MAGFRELNDAIRRTPHGVSGRAAEHRARGGADDSEGDDAAVLAKKANLNPSFEHALGVRSRRKGRT
jgi:hypothetical protein